MKYKCPECGAIAEIDKEKKTITVEVQAGKIPAPSLGVMSSAKAFTFPSHFDCEFNKPVDEIDLDLLEEVDHVFLYETYRGVPR